MLKQSQSVAEVEAPAMATTAVSNSNPVASEPIKREKILKEPPLWQYNFGLQDPGLALPHGIVKDVTAPEKFVISEEQIRTLEEDGVVHIKGVFDQEWVDYRRNA